MKIEAKNVNKQNQRAIPINLEMVRHAYKQVRRKGNSAGIDRISLKQFQEREEDNLYVVYNRMSSGSYFPPGVKQVNIPKGNGKTRKLGIPTVRDRSERPSSANCSQRAYRAKNR
jgi:retron-type reverse transcriptase